MNERKLSNWLTSYVSLASVTEAPEIYHFWSGVSALSGALRRHVWFDQIQFVWYPGFYVVFVADPGIATKSTATGYAMDLLSNVPGIHFGPDHITWERLVTKFTESTEGFEHNGVYIPQSAMTVFASEFGMLLDFKNSDFVNLLIDLWDGRKSFKKETKGSGSDIVEAPYVNLIACTTPSWISANMDRNTIGGGFTSRCIFVLGEEKARLVPYIEDAVLQVRSIAEHERLRQNLIHDLEHISVNLIGRYVLSPEAKAWGTKWYEELWGGYDRTKPDYHNNYVARKQAHLHKLAMIIAAAQRDELVITLDDLRLAEIMLNDTDKNFHKVFEGVGATTEAVQADEIREMVKAKKKVPYKDLLRAAQIYWPAAKDLEDVVATFYKMGDFSLTMENGEGFVTWTGGD